MHLGKNTKIELIKNIPLFTRLSRKELEQVAALADEIDFPAGKTIIREGERGREFFAIGQQLRQFFFQIRFAAVEGVELVFDQPFGIGSAARGLSDLLLQRLSLFHQGDFLIFNLEDLLFAQVDLMGEGLAVHVPADAVTSRTQGNWRLGTEQLRQAGAVVTATETLVFQLLGQADTDDFRELARLVR